MNRREWFKTGLGALIGTVFGIKAIQHEVKLEERATVCQPLTSSSSGSVVNILEWTGAPATMITMLYDIGERGKICREIHKYKKINTWQPAPGLNEVVFEFEQCSSEKCFCHSYFENRVVRSHFRSFTSLDIEPSSTLPRPENQRSL